MTRTTWRTARKRRQCHARLDGCVVVIQPGDRYAESVASPNHDDLNNQRWWRNVTCSVCSRTYIDIPADPLAPVQEHV